MLPPEPSAEIAVLVPCYNGEAAIGKVIAGFRGALPEACLAQRAPAEERKRS
jgi:hypothetical protein